VPASSSTIAASVEPTEKPTRRYARESDIVGEIGEVIIGRDRGGCRRARSRLFDSTGIALQNSATVALEYEREEARWLD
jgi:ornithine cyclodeaminase/alanine dehydrogenase-like protein (mu-crystallin family)